MSDVVGRFTMMVLSSRPSRRKRVVPCVERVTVLFLLMLAWSWIIAAVIVVWHTTTKKDDNNNAAGMSQHSPPVQQQQQQQESDSLPSHSPLLIFTCRRAEYLRTTLTDVLRYLPEDCRIGCPIIISQDGTDASVTKVVREFQSQHSAILHWQHAPPALRRGKLNPYQALAVHYGWALARVFSLPSTQRVLILEEDLHISPDFFFFFEKMTPLLDRDTSLLAVSAFNDNGLKGKVRDATRILKTDFFPGLGWCMTKRLWEEELSQKWPEGYWDDWLREPAQRQGRHILRPEISRTFHFGTHGGASLNQFGDQLGSILLNQEAVNWSRVNVEYLEENYEASYLDMVQSSLLTHNVGDALQDAKIQNVRLEYSTFAEFQQIATQLHLMADEKAGVPRTAYKGIVETRPHGDYLLFLIPKDL